MSKWLMVTLGCARRSGAAVQWLHSAVHGAAVQQYSGYTRLCSSTVVTLSCARHSGAAVQWLNSAVHGAAVQQYSGYTRLCTALSLSWWSERCVVI